MHSDRPGDVVVREIMAGGQPLYWTPSIVKRFYETQMRLLLRLLNVLA